MTHSSNVAFSSEDNFRLFAAAKNAIRTLRKSRNADAEAFAHGFCAAAMSEYWACVRLECVVDWAICGHSLRVVQNLTSFEAELATELGRTAARLPVVDAAFHLGSLYTELLVPEQRSRTGAFYTPIALVQHLLEQCEAAGISWETAKAIDPSCGSGVFLVAVAERMRRASTLEPSALLADISARLRGLELDPFAAWLAQVFLEAALLATCAAARARLPRLVRCADALTATVADVASFDLVIGNPPYGKIRLDVAMRRRFERSLFGHANLYGLFLHLGTELLRPFGLMAFVVPTSFLGGQYFKALRALLSSQCPLTRASFVENRNAVFDGVLQETMLAVFRKDGDTPTAAEHPLSTVNAVLESVRPDGLNAVLVEPIGVVGLPPTEEPWLLPRSAFQITFVNRLRELPSRLVDYGYGVSTGPLVWNRHKDQLHQEHAEFAYPLVWAECVSMSGFAYKAEQRNHAPWICLRPGQHHLLTAQPAILVQRTTAKEQRRRIVAARTPDYLFENGGQIVVENHLNLVRAITTTDFGLHALHLMLSHPCVDDAFRCISGSVAVSAYELEAIPLPPIEVATGWAARLAKDGDEIAFAQAVAAYYGCD